MPCHISRDEVLQLVSYDPETGKFTRLKTGKQSGNISIQGYQRIGLAGKSYYGAHLAWFIMTGEWPAQIVDHVNEDRADDSWANLRLADKSQNAANTSKTSGIYFHKTAGKFAASLQVNGVRRHLGLYPSAEAAVAAYQREHAIAFKEFSPYYKGPAHEV